MRGAVGGREGGQPGRAAARWVTGERRGRGEGGPGASGEHLPGGVCAWVIPEEGGAAGERLCCIGGECGKRLW